MSICCVSICPSHAKISTVHNLMYVSVGGVTVRLLPSKQQIRVRLPANAFFVPPIEEVCLLNVHQKIPFSAILKGSNPFWWRCMPYSTLVCN